MPSPIGHILAGATIAWGMQATADSSSEPLVPYGRLAVVCAAIAAAPDLDLALRMHRTYTHSLGATLLVGLVAAAGAAYARLPVARITIACAAAHASHIFLDWLAVDRSFPYGIQALWPFGNVFYISGLDLFRQTVRRPLFTEYSMRANALAVVQELVILGPIAFAVWLAAAARGKRAPGALLGHPSAQKTRAGDPAGDAA